MPSGNFDIIEISASSPTGPLTVSYQNCPLEYALKDFSRYKKNEETLSIKWLPLNGQEENPANDPESTSTYSDFIQAPHFT